MQPAREKLAFGLPPAFAAWRARIWRLTRSSHNPLVRELLLVPLAVCLIVVAWSLLVVWYLVFGFMSGIIIPIQLIMQTIRQNKRATPRPHYPSDAATQARSGGGKELSDDEIVTVILPVINNGGK